MLEKDMLKKLKRRIKTESINVLLQPIESGRTGLGIPDIFWKTDFNQGWIELKQVYVTKYGKVVVPFRPGQLPWARKYIALNGNMILLATFENTTYGKNTLIAVHGNNIMHRYESINELNSAACFADNFGYFNLEQLLSYTS